MKDHLFVRDIALIDLAALAVNVDGWTFEGLLWIVAFGGAGTKINNTSWCQQN